MINQKITLNIVMEIFIIEHTMYIIALNSKLVSIPTTSALVFVYLLNLFLFIQYFTICH